MLRGFQLRQISTRKRLAKAKAWECKTCNMTKLDGCRELVTYATTSTNAHSRMKYCTTPSAKQNMGVKACGGETGNTISLSAAGSHICKHI